MQTSQNMIAKPLPQPELARGAEGVAKPPIPFFTAVFGMRAEAVDSAELERVVELGYN